MIGSQRVAAFPQDYPLGLVVAASVSISFRLSVCLSSSDNEIAPAECSQWLKTGSRLQIADFRHLYGAVRKPISAGVKPLGLMPTARVPSTTWDHRRRA